MSGLAVVVLKEIREELRTTRTELTGRIDTTNDRLDTTNSRLDRIERRQTDMETRIATELVAVVGAINDLKDTLLPDHSVCTPLFGSWRERGGTARR